MAIRLKDADSSLGRIIPVLAGVDANLAGVHSEAPVYLGVLASDLQNLSAQVTGVHVENSNYSGVIGAQLSGLTAALQGTLGGEPAGDIAFNTVWGAAGDLSLDQTLNYDYFNGTDSVTGQNFTGTTVGSAARPRVWGDPWPTRPPSIHKIGGPNGGPDAYFSTSIVSGVNGPGGTSNESVLRVRPLQTLSGPAQANLNITNTATRENMGMVYVRYKRRIRDFTGSIGGGYQYMGAFKTGDTSSYTDRRIGFFVARESGIGWVLRISTSLAISDFSGGTVWEGKAAQALPRPWDAYWYRDPDGMESIWYKGCFEDYTGAGEAPEPNWNEWATFVYAFRLESTSEGVAGNAAQGWTYVGTCVGSETAAADNSQIKTRFYLAGPNLYNSRFTTPAGLSGILLTTNTYGSYPAGYDHEIGSLEVYDHWPADHPAAERPAGAI